MPQKADAQGNLLFNLPLCKLLFDKVPRSALPVLNLPHLRPLFLSPPFPLPRTRYRFLPTLPPFSPIFPKVLSVLNFPTF